MLACVEGPFDESSGDRFVPAKNPALKREIRAARRAMILPSMRRVRCTRRRRDALDEIVC